MSSSLTFRLQQESLKAAEPATLPSPPSSSDSGDEAMGDSPSNPLDHSSFSTTTTLSTAVPSSVSSARRDSLPTHFNALTIQQFSTSLPENYTIDHSTTPINIQQKPATTTTTTTTANANLSATATATAITPNSNSNNNASSIKSSSVRRTSHIASSLPRAESLPFYSHSPVAAAAATGGRTIRHRRQSESTLSRSARGQTHKCQECGKVYKHPNCLTKHLWEHSEQWELTSKLLLTKHQQVQMLEAAAILVGMESKKRRPSVATVKQEDEEDEYDDDTKQSGEDDRIEGDDDDDIVDDIDDDDDILIDMDEDIDVKPSVASTYSLNVRTSMPSVMAPSSVRHTLRKQAQE
ncbi:hypothetical protein BCR43DRAFT_494516 [Syncephalastrum racemosum]|uniref:C2H2-type domain-containing protein n=1 Tax=Syncephalastrum racemosum TaxID=13706 RepID=A0A1X2H834_SYNRA|nr:hypothetical protein BCR43DRAFT_494516 [Syncephalastrum racemosum]